jgi:pimeloyl-ACP methyl ester carboxylesterase
VLFAHGSGSSRFSPRNQYVARVLNDENIATLLMDLLTPEEEQVDEYTREHRFNIQLLADRLVGAIAWLDHEKETKGLKIGLFGSSTGAAAALVAAAVKPELVSAVVSASTLFIVGGWDYQVIELNEEAFAVLSCEKRMEIVPEATHLFEEPGKLEEAARLACGWFKGHLRE